MSDSPKTETVPANPPARGISILTLILALALAVTTTAAVLLAVLHLTGSSRVGTPASGVGGLVAAVTGEGPLAQQGSVRTEEETTGVVYYPIPYASPPNLTLTSPQRRYTLLEQSETGFTWSKGSVIEALKGVADEVKGKEEKQPKPKPAMEEFTWEAKGVRGNPNQPSMRLLEQKGSFMTVGGQEGEVNFPYPYTTAPHVELSGSFNCHESTVIAECKPTGFKWKNVGDPKSGRTNGDVRWTAKGIKATTLPK